MKKLACEMCGSTNLVKEEGLFVCQSCGAKYSPEEAKKMMVEGTVKVDTSSEAENLKKLAKRHYDDGEYEKAYDYYGRIIELNPDDWEAIYYRGLASAFQSTFTNIRINEAIIGAKNAIKLMKNENLDEKKEEFRTDLINIIINSGGWIIGNYNNDFSENDIDLLVTNINDLIDLSEEVLSVFPPKKIVKNDDVFTLYTYIIELCVEFCSDREFLWGYNTSTGANKYETYRINRDPRSFIVGKYDNYVAKVKEYDESFIPAPIKRTGDSGDFCYVATFVYGSYDCPEVWILRRFRDNNLKKSWYGKLFIKIYYTFSPIIVEFFGSKRWFNRIFKYRLDRFIRKLQDKGIDSSPYTDE